MKNLLFLIAILSIIPAFASCPIDGNSSACIAEFQQTSIPDVTQNPALLSTPAPANTFSATPPIIDTEREIGPTKNLRNFGTTSQDYGYNSSCQFGVCMETGTPKTFRQNQN